MRCKRKNGLQKTRQGAHDNQIGGVSTGERRARVRRSRAVGCWIALDCSAAWRAAPSMIGRATPTNEKQRAGSWCRRSDCAAAGMQGRREAGAVVCARSPLGPRGRTAASARRRRPLEARGQRADTSCGAAGWPGAWSHRLVKREGRKQGGRTGRSQSAPIGGGKGVKGDFMLCIRFCS